eukprot:CAMPEP_0183332578 /NCGR_PEP_ID=MMETSP0164_2-20130417/1708_1 /TAXON_ID=221442 /ORGANISM="Coccolithus pelagicus ssp braarudi, Strain PLY182g" /LENGTH=53 /DNA_ID=CAMNT_0025501323 /DNA_START=274 /DNA_END=435 /DNA_ORIENTATION=-
MKPLRTRTVQDAEPRHAAPQSAKDGWFEFCCVHPSTYEPTTPNSRRPLVVASC